jgi:hypothetical protein
LVTFVVVYVTLDALFGTVTLFPDVEHFPEDEVVQERVVVAPPETANVTVAPATARPFWSARLTSTHELHVNHPVCPDPVSRVIDITVVPDALSTFTCTGLDVALLPTTSVARAVTVCAPLPTVAVFHVA